MPWNEPEPLFGTAERRVLELLARWLLETARPRSGDANLVEGEVPLSDAEATELLSLMEAVVNSRQFMEGSYLVEGLTTPAIPEEARLREIYFSGRKRRGRDRVMSSMRWNDFLARLGLRRSLYPQNKVSPMSAEQFLELEERLFRAAGLRPQVIRILMKVVRQHVSAIERARRGSAALKHGSIRRVLLEAVGSFRRSGRRQLEGGKLSTKRLSAIMIVVANVSVLFSTRDWDVAGFFSAITGALAGAAAP